MFWFPEILQTRNVFSKARILFLDEREKQTWQPLITQAKDAKKKKKF